MSYKIEVVVSREWLDDQQIVENNEMFHGMTYREAFKQQFHAELQKMWDKSGGDLVGLFQIKSVYAEGKQADKELDALVPTERIPTKKKKEVRGP